MTTAVSCYVYIHNAHHAPSNHECIQNKVLRMLAQDVAYIAEAKVIIAMRFTDVSKQNRIEIFGMI